MNAKVIFTRWFAYCLVTTLSASALADIINIGGPLTPGHARPPLFLNTGPFRGPLGRGGGNPGASAASVYYVPAQIRQAYGFDMVINGGNDGTGQTIAIVDAYGSKSIQSDLDTFCAQFGLPPINNLEIYYAQGSSGRPSTGWAQETSLDVEWAHAIAPGARTVLVVAKSSSFSDLLGAVSFAADPNGPVHANVVSMSWGGNEFSSETSYDTYFSVPGVTFIASSGDNGEGVEWPAASPNVVAIGGTSLYLNSDSTYASETAWSGSGGGISAYESMPTWQAGWSQYLTSTRGVPDVSYVADPYTGVYVIYNGGAYVFGGTSVGAPQWAALVALSQSANGNEAIYSLANGGVNGSLYAVNSTYLHDITSGSNHTDPDDQSIPGYDLVTGLGSPVASSLVPALGGSSPPPSSPDFTISVSPSSATVPPGGGTVTYTVAMTALNGFSDSVALSLSSDPALPSGTSTTFTPSTVDSTTASSTLSIVLPSSTTTGNYNLTVTGTDTSDSSHTRSATATLVVADTPSTVGVTAISYSLSGHNGSNLNVTLQVEDDLGSPAPNASVSITLANTTTGQSWAGTATTGSTGQVTFTLRKAPSGTYETAVTGVSAAGLSWDGNTPPNTYTK